MWIIGGVLSFYLLQKLAALLAVGLFLLAVWMKSKISHMDVKNGTSISGR